MQNSLKILYLLTGILPLSFTMKESFIQLPTQTHVSSLILQHASAPSVYYLKTGTPEEYDAKRDKEYQLPLMRY
jgi:hypothetical protein